MVRQKYNAAVTQFTELRTKLSHPDLNLERLKQRKEMFVQEDLALEKERAHLDDMRRVLADKQKLHEMTLEKRARVLTQLDTDESVLAQMSVIHQTMHNTNNVLNTISQLPL